MKKQRKLIKETKENEKISKNEIGITLIALVVTIIILIILAGISIGSLSGEKGIIDNAKFAKNETNKSKVEEQIYLSILEAEQENENASLQNVKDKLKENGLISEDSQVDENGKITTNEGYEFEGKLDDYLGIKTGDAGSDSSGSTGENTNNEQLDDLKRKVEDLTTKVTEQEEKIKTQTGQIEEQKQQIQNQETKMTNMTTWKTLDISNYDLKFPTTNWTSKNVTIPELSGVNRMAIIMNYQRYTFYIDNMGYDGILGPYKPTISCIAPYHGTTQYQFWVELGIDFRNGELTLETREASHDEKTYPSIQQIMYIKY